MLRRHLLTLALSCLGLSTAFAQDFPTRPMSILVPYGAGGGTDMFARALASKLGHKLGQNVVVENFPGAGGAIALQKLSGAAADGHTLYAGSGMEYEMLALANPDAPKRSTELQPIGVIGFQPMVLVARPGLGIKTVDALIERAKAQPGKLSIAAVGPGTALQITGLMIQQAAGIELIDVPYKVSGPMVTDLLAGTVDLALLTPALGRGMIDEGKIVPIAISQAQRSAVMPGVPSLAETPALKNIDTKIGYPLYGPKGMPQAAVTRIAKAAEEVLRDPQFQEVMDKLLIAPAPRVLPADADALKNSQLSQFNKALALRTQP